MTAPRISSLLLGVASFAVAISAQSAPVLKSGDYIAICGDSITEQKIYSDYMEEYFLACQPAPKLQASQFGWGGETSWQFNDRMENDVLGFKPTVATICYGMNDGSYTKTKPELLAQYTEAVTNIVKKFKAAGVREIVVGTAGAVDSTSFKGALFRPIKPGDYNQTLSDFGKAAEAVAKKENVIFANLHDPGIKLMAEMKKKYGDSYLLFGDDGIHPKEAGHLMMAYSFLKALGCDGNIGTITLDMGSGHAKATDGHKVLSATRNSVKLESIRYPFCFYGDPSTPTATNGVIEFLPFNEDLNRLILVVRNAPMGKVKVTWGTQSKEFTGAQLAKGINLAAEFLDNPFSQPFKNVHEAVLKQQRFETPMVKSLIHSLPDMEGNLPEKRAYFEALRSSLISTDEELRKAAVESVVPVQHEIQIGS